MRCFAVTGNPILHSKSPEMFRAAFPKHKDLAYFRMAAVSAEEAMELFEELGLSGMNITAPFKFAANWTSACQSEAVKVLQAGNTLYLQGKNLLFENTDIEGVSGAIEAIGMDIAGKKCLVIGAGGAGRAAAYALLRKGGDLILANRTIERAKQISEIIGCRYCELDELAQKVQEAEIIVNTVYAGIEIVKKEWLHEGQVVLDAIYSDSYLKQFTFEKGVFYIDGRQWLLHQGIPAYRNLVGEEPDRIQMERVLTRDVRPKHIVLVGFMGVGKSSVAPLLAEKMKLLHVDTDQEIEKRVRMSIPRIMEQYGEPYFRELESDVLREFLARKEAYVISSGGGTVLRPENRRMLQEYSRVIWLYARPAICIDRIEVETRPLLARYADPARAAKELFESRKFDYARTADLLVSTNFRTIDEVSEVIYGEISKVY